MNRCDVVVVGGGAMGSATAWWLARRGHDTVLLERFEQGHVRGSSHGGSRIFRLAYDDPRYVRMALEAMLLWRALEDDAGEQLLEVTGGVDHGDPGALADISGALTHEGVVHEMLPADAAAERWPGMRFGGAVISQPDAGRCRADAAVAALQRRAAHHGADVRFAVGAATVSLTADGCGAVVRAADREWLARAVVVTAGAWAAAVVPPSTPQPSLVVTAEQVQHFTPTDPTAPWPSFIHHRREVVYGLLTPGEGVKAAWHHAGPRVDPDRRSFEIDADAADAMARYVDQWLPGVEPTPVHATTCLYTSTPDHHFLIERCGPVVVGSACSGHGFKFTPLIGRMLADLAEGRAGPADPS